MNPPTPHRGGPHRLPDLGRLNVAPGAPLPIIERCRWCDGELRVCGPVVYCRSCDHDVAGQRGNQ